MLLILDCALIVRHCSIHFPLLLLSLDIGIFWNTILIIHSQIYDDLIWRKCARSRLLRLPHPFFPPFIHRTSFWCSTWSHYIHIKYSHIYFPLFSLVAWLGFAWGMLHGISIGFSFSTIILEGMPHRDEKEFRWIDKYPMGHSDVLCGVYDRYRYTAAS